MAEVGNLKLLARILALPFFGVFGKVQAGSELTYERAAFQARSRSKGETSALRR